MKKFTQTILAIALAAAGAQAFAATNSIIDKKLVDKVLSRPEIATTGNLTDKEYANKVFANSGHQDAGPMPRDPESLRLYQTNKNRIDMARTSVCAKFALDAVNGVASSASYGSLAEAPLGEDGKSQLIKACGDAFDAASRSIANYQIAKVLERAETSGPVMRMPTSKLSEQAEMELAGYERVGTFKSSCISSNGAIAIMRSDGHKNFKAKKVEECEVYQKRDKELPGLSAN